MSSRHTKPAGPVVLCILDGFGHRTDRVNNAIELADTPNYDRWRHEAPFALMKTSGLSVGLPDGQMGNSEVGHMNIGAGRVVLQDLPRIDAAIENGSLWEQPTLISHTEALKSSGGACHLMGLLSPGGVHSHQSHIAALAQHLHAQGIKVWIHAFLDGRDTPPESAHDFLKEFLDAIGDSAEIATMTGRYFAMDRDRNWDRVERAYHAMVHAKPQAPEHKTSDLLAALKASYAAKTSDEFVVPHVSSNFEGMASGDGLLMANFRADRAREILTALVDLTFEDFDQGPAIEFAARTGLVEYSSDLSRHMEAIFPNNELTNTLGECVAKAGLKQLRIAETEKYAHVTFFLNGGREKVFEGEERILVPSPKVATYDLQPEMSAPEVTHRLDQAIRSNDFDLIVVNFANPDMVGHTGILSAAIEAVETIDACLGRLEVAIKDSGGLMLVTADHGNIELMRDPETEVPHTAHTTFDVPIFLLNAEVLPNQQTLKPGRLADIAPTILTLMGLTVPSEMTGRSLIGEPAPVS